MNRLSTFAALTIAVSTYANPAFAQDSFNATFDTAPSSACAPLPGTGPCTNFTINLAGVDFNFVFNASGDGGDLIWQNAYGQADSASMNLLSGSFNLATVESFSIKRADGQQFQFDGIYITNTDGTGVTVGGYWNGNNVGAPQVVDSGPLTGVNYTFGGILVDEVRVSASDLYNFNIDSFRGTIPAPNSAPVVTASSGDTNAPEQTATVIDSGITVADAENSTLPSATVSVTANFAAGQDVIGLTNDGSTMGNITGSFNAGTGVLSLTSAGGTATIAQWQAALRSVTYTNNSNTPATSDRSVSFIVSDGTASSTAGVKTVTVSPVNDSPDLIMPGELNAQRNVATAITGVSTSDPDAVMGSVALTLSAPSGSFAGTSSGGVTVSGSGTSIVSLTGTVADINAYLASSNLNYTSVVSPPPSLVIFGTLTDNGNTGSGGAKSAQGTSTVTITAPASVGDWFYYNM